MRQLLLALQFLTILPVKVSGAITENNISGSVVFFPITGALQGLLAVCTALLSVNFFSPEITAGLVLLTLIVSNGGFHLDGVADTFDALAVKSGGNLALDRDRKLDIMKDSTTGAIGAVAVVMTLLLKFLFLKNLLVLSLSASNYAFLFLMPVFSKWAMVVTMYHGNSARQDGLGKMFIDNINSVKVFFASLLLVLFYAAAYMLSLHKAYGISSLALFFVLVAVLYIFCLLSVKFFDSRFGGLTGDTLGASGEISEILFLMVALLWLQHSI